MAGASNIRAGGAYVELFTKDALTRGLRAAEAKLRAFGASVTAMGQRLVTVGVGLGAPMVAAVAAWTKMGSEMLDASQRMGISVEALSELRFAAEQSGASLEELENGFKFMQRGGFGRTAEDFQRIAEEIAALPDPMLRTQRAMEVFGRAGTRLLPMAMDLAALRKEARDLGLVMSTEDARAAEAFGDQMSALWRSVKMTAFAFAAELGPALKSIARIILGGVKTAREWIQENKGVATAIGLVTVGLLAAGVAVMVVGKAFTIMGAAVGAVVGIVSFAFGILKAVFIAVKVVAAAMWSAVLGPIGLIVAGVVGLGAYFFATSQQGQRAASAIGAGFRGMGETVRTAWGGIMAALSAGDLQGAMRIAVISIQILWLQFVDTVKNAWREFANWFSGTWLGQIIGAITQAIDRINIFAAEAQLARAEAQGQQLDRRRVQEERDRRRREQIEDLIDRGLATQGDRDELSQLTRHLPNWISREEQRRRDRRDALEGRAEAGLQGLVGEGRLSQEELLRLRRTQGGVTGRLVQEGRLSQQDAEELEALWRSPRPPLNIQGVGPQQALPPLPGQANPQIAALQRALSGEIWEQWVDRFLEEVQRPAALPRGAGEVGGALQQAERRIETSGTFSAAAVAGLGASNLTDLMREGNEFARRTAENTGRMADDGGVVTMTG